MSIEYGIVNFGGPPPPDEEMMAEDWRPLPLGDGASVRDQISRYVKEVFWEGAEPYEGGVVDNDYLIGISLRSEDDGLVYWIGVTAYGVADAESFMRRFCLPNGWYVVAAATGQWIPPDELGQSFDNQNGA